MNKIMFEDIPEDQLDRIMAFIINLSNKEKRTCYKDSDGKYKIIIKEMY